MSASIALRRYVGGEYRQQHSQPVMQQLYEWLNQHQLTVPSSSPTAKAINYTLKRWPALSRYLDDGNLPIDNNWAENSMRPWALGRKNWLFAGSLRSGQRAANIMTLIQSAKLKANLKLCYNSTPTTSLPIKHSLAKCTLWAQGQAILIC